MRVTAQVRGMLREYGMYYSGYVWTNRYKNCWTVKTYAELGPVGAEEKFMSEVVKIPGVTVKLRPIRQWTYNGPVVSDRKALIVRIPKDIN